MFGYTPISPNSMWPRPVATSVVTLARQRLTISYQVDGNFSIRTSTDRDRERLPGVDRSTGNRDNAIAGPDIAALGG